MINFKEFVLTENKTSLLEEGGAAGHMLHIIDNKDLTFKQIKDILIKASEGKIEGTEKTDGQNLLISYSVKDGRAKAVRNKSNIKAGGLNVDQLTKMFAGKGPVEDTFADALRMFEKAVRTLSPQQQEKIFGPDANIYYNTEVMDPRSANIINYDKKTLAVHQVGHAMYDRETGTATPVDVTQNAAILDSVIDDMQETIQDENYYIVKNAVRNLEALSDDRALRTALQNLEALQNREGLDDNATIGNYVKSRMWGYLKKQLPRNVLQVIGKDLLSRMIGEGGTVTSIIKNLPEEYKQQVKDIVNQDKELLKQMVYPIEDVIHDFTVEILKSVQSAYIINNKREVKRLRNEVAAAIKAIQSSNNEIAHEVLKRELQKLKSVDRINTAIEGFVFDYNGKTYKLTGNFTPIHRILSLFKYGKKGMEPIKENNEVELMVAESIKLLSEGGNVFKDPKVRRINKDEIPNTLKWLESITGLPLVGNVLGSVGLKASSGDLDVAVDANKISKEALIGKLSNWALRNNVDPKEFIKKSGINVHFKTPIMGNEANGFVQTDFMFSDNMPWIKWTNIGFGDNTKYSGAQRHVLLSSIAKALGLRWGPVNGLTERETGKAYPKDPNVIAKVLLGPKYSMKDLASVESILNAIKDRPNYEELVADARETFPKYGVSL